MTSCVYTENKIENEYNDNDNAKKMLKTMFSSKQ